MRVTRAGSTSRGLTQIAAPKIATEQITHVLTGVVFNDALAPPFSYRIP